MKLADRSRRIGNALSLLSPWMAWVGYITSCAFWHEYQSAFAIMDGFIWMIGSLVVIYAARLNHAVGQKELFRYWMISVPAISLFVLSILYNALACEVLAPYPLPFAARHALLRTFLLLLVGVNVTVEAVLYKRMKQ